MTLPIIQPSEYKSFKFEPLATDAALGIVEHLISVYGVLDLGGDICHPGCFAKTLAERKDQIRVLDSHQRRTTANVIGIPLELKEIGRGGLPADVLEKYPEATGGLLAKTQFLMDTPEGKGAFARIVAGAVTEFSFSYDTLDSDYSEAKGRRVRNLRTLRLWEYGPVIFGMNPATAVINAKDLGGSEAKPEPEESENVIRVRVKSPSLFEKDSFKTITVGAKGKGIKAIVGKLKGETTMTIQSYIFDKSKWSKADAVAWVKEHGDKKDLSYSDVVDKVRRGFSAEFNSSGLDSYRYRYNVKEVLDTYLVVEDLDAWAMYKVDYTLPESGPPEFAEAGKWIVGKYEFIALETQQEEDTKLVVLALALEQEMFDLSLIG